MGSSSSQQRAALEVDALRIEFPGPEGIVTAAHNVSFSVAPSSTLGIVGESGAGKSVTLRAICGLVPAPGRVVGGEIRIGDRSYAAAGDLTRICGSDVSMIFQDPASSLDPVLSIGTQLKEVLTSKMGMQKRDARTRAVELLELVELPSPARRLNSYPHELSGGMRQRVMIALALACEPRVLLADEPTTALDVTTQARILELLRNLQQETNMAIVFVTHDLGVVAELCNEVAVMYAGFIVERAPIERLVARARHPYSNALLEAVPQVYVKDLPRAIPGETPDLEALPAGCPFQPRCDYVRPSCAQLNMELETLKGSACPFVDAGLARPGQADS